MKTLKTDILYGLRTARRILLSLMIAFAIACVCIAPLSAHAVSLKQQSVVQDSTIKLSDLFHGVREEDAQRVLGLAPHPGQEMVLNARTLLRVAIALDLPWRPSSSADQVVVKRAASVVSRDTIEALLLDSLAEKGVKGQLQLTVGSGADQIILPEDMPATAEVIDLEYRPESNWFAASIVAPSADNQAFSGRITGTFERLVEVPVLKATLRNGTVIGMRDLETIALPERSVQHDVIVDVQELVGMTPRRQLYMGKPVKTGEIEAPRIVSRGELVTMVFTEGALKLTARGKALENGAKGDFIRVTNVNSSKTLEARVTNAREVTVTDYQ